ncbi:MAG: hypothetical protein HY758_03155 [Nitrospirae bacterium]|nr:hypothetical protein [Nitrospirota bacterium]
MFRSEHFRVKALLFIVFGILSLCISFILISCGSGPQLSGPQLKVAATNNGAFALDLSRATGGVQWGSVAYVDEDVDDAGNPVLLNKIPNMEGIKEFTVEAWIKPRTSSLSGFLYAFYDTKGTVLWIKENKPVFGLLMAESPTSTAYSVTSGVVTGETDIVDKWYHVAGVLVNENHSIIPAAHAACGGAEAQTPHLDIYINGVWKDCASVVGKSTPHPATTQMTFGGSPAAGISAVKINGVDRTSELQLANTAPGQKFEGVIDEVRFWIVARSASQIRACMYTELGYDGTCAINSSQLKLYYRFNDGKNSPAVYDKGVQTGQSVTDSSGNALGASTQGLVDAVDGGWAAGYPF